jgi:hypothetical protein
MINYLSALYMDVDYQRWKNHAVFILLIIDIAMNYDYYILIENVAYSDQ